MAKKTIPRENLFEPAEAIMEVEPTIVHVEQSSNTAENDRKDSEGKTPSEFSISAAGKNSFSKHISNYLFHSHC